MLNFLRRKIRTFLTMELYQSFNCRSFHNLPRNKLSFSIGRIILVNKIFNQKCIHDLKKKKKWRVYELLTRCPFIRKKSQHFFFFQFLLCELLFNFYPWVSCFIIIIIIFMYYYFIVYYYCYCIVIMYYYYYYYCISLNYYFHLLFQFFSNLYLLFIIIIFSRKKGDLFRVFIVFISHWITKCNSRYIF